MMINYAHRQLAGTEDEYPRIAKTTKPSGQFVQWLLEDELRSDPKNASSAKGLTQTGKTYFAKEVVFVEDYAGTDVTDIFVHIYEVVPATKPDGTLDVFNATAGAEVGWGLAGRKYTFKIDGSIVDIVAKGKGSIKSNEELSKVISDDENREAFLAEDTTPVFKNVYNYTCFYPINKKNGSEEPTWQVVPESGYASLFDLYVTKWELIQSLSSAGALSDKGKSKVKKDEEKKKKKSGVVLPDDKKKKTTDTSSGGAGWLALLGVAAAAYIYSQNK